MNLYLAGTSSRPYVFENIGGGKTMNIYLAGEHPVKNGRLSYEGGRQKILESFYYCRSNDWIPKLLPYLGDFLLDSGAFTFMQGAAHVDWDAYVEEYAAWINKYKIEKFFELDIDSVVGLKEVERLRKKLEGLTNRQPIPVWHVSRGWDYFQRMCDEFKYVAFGGLHTDGVSSTKLEKAFPTFINHAHKKGAKIHGLGYTSIAGLKKFHWDSVDSTAWLYGNRGGYLYVFNPKTGDMDKRKKTHGQRLKSSQAAMHNFNEWVKFQKYAEKYL